MHRALSCLLLLVSCGEGDNPFADSGPRRQADGAMDAGVTDTGAVTDSGVTNMDGGEDIDTGTMTGCAPTPTRMVVLGDSIMACVGAGGKTADTCAPKAIHTALETSVAPGLTYENVAVGGAVTADVVTDQLQNVPGGPGRVVVFIYVGGNDLAQYIFVSDQEAQNGYDRELPGIILAWNNIFAFFADAARFPDGATIVMNTQYNPFDDCTAPPYNLSQLKTSLLHDFNMNLTDLAAMNADAHIVDQHGPFLGHGHHNDVMSCPHYVSGLDNWMADLIHANEAGHANFVIHWQALTDQLYVDCQ